MINISLKEVLTKILTLLKSHSTTIASHTTSINELNSKATVNAITVNMTSTTGTFVSSNCRRVGNVVWFSIAVRNTSSVAAGANIYQGTASATLPRPVAFTTSGSYYGAHAVTGSVNSEGNVIIRNASSSAFSIGSSSTATVAFTYITAD